MLTYKQRLTADLIERDVAKRRGRIVPFAFLIKLPALERVSELLAEGYSNQEIADLLGYKSAATVNAQLQRIRHQLGEQAR